MFLKEISIKPMHSIIAVEVAFLRHMMSKYSILHSKH